MAKEEVGNSFFSKNTVTVAKNLLGCMVIHDSPKGPVGGYIVETEAYLGLDDPACHSVRGKTKRNETMFLGSGLVYIYLIYGLYYCLNFTSDVIEKPEAVLIRAIQPVEGIDLMKINRNKTNPKDLCSGPGKLAQALDIDLRHDGTKIGDKIKVLEGLDIPENNIVKTTRIGITKAADLPLRFYIKDNEFISKL